MHGGNLRRAQELYGLDSFIDLSANINPFGPPPGVWAALQKGMGDIVYYPDPESLALRKKLSNHLEQPKKTIMVGNGAGELIFTIVQALKPKKVAIPIPTFSEYERAARSVGAEVHYIPLGPEGWAKFNRRDGESENPRSEGDSDPIWSELLKGCDLLFLCSPHNPTGSVLEKDTFERILNLTKEIGCRILFDESFLDFLPDEDRHSARSYLAANEHLMVLYSLTKFYSIPGLRLGTVFASQSLIANFEQYRDPWSVNVLAQHAGITALEDSGFPDEVREKLRESRLYFYREFALAEFLDLKLWPTSVNFALIEVLNQTPEPLIQHLGRSGILVRDCASFAGLPGNFIRVAIKDIFVMQQLLEGLQGFLVNDKGGGNNAHS
ncbi:histidinol-phosphate transaminase [Desulfosporosinus sp. BICA1-9]|uniref:pyridoxal phosphate-dependent aminotransferase n=1 Tax=Desulfosporosinus sp. BICA1-9 TaxID=1531958 RepID=UPI00054C7B30|nr:threonine-phosphate decarboxylase [Desulfosporosinus sp. BICA1-9]KJS90417.1 MAG: cobyric acid decarboxylase [Desulfosporosinus sp. BICA1-9]HBW34855.1 threonine-phosphate decarboxylase [Desulfosporosinus sp.]